MINLIQRFISLLIPIVAVATCPIAYADTIADQARTDLAKSHIQVFYYALQRYKLDSRKYPTTEQGLEALLTKPTTAPIPKYWRGPYYEPKNARLPKDPWGHAYHYKNNNGKIDIYSYGADGKPGGKGINADIHLKQLENL